MEVNKKLKLVKEGDYHHLMYENNHHKYYKEIDSEEFNNLFKKIEPNFSFSFPDKLIQDFVKDGSIIPSFKKSEFYTKDDLDEIVTPLKKDFKYISNKKNNKKHKKNYMKKQTRRNKPKSKRSKLYEKVLKKKVSKNNNKKTMKSKK